MTPERVNTPAPEVAGAPAPVKLNAVAPATGPVTVLPVWLEVIERLVKLVVPARETWPDPATIVSPALAVAVEVKLVDTMTTPDPPLPPIPEVPPPPPPPPPVLARADDALPEADPEAPLPEPPVPA